MGTYVRLVFVACVVGMGSGQSPTNSCEPDPAVRRELAELEARMRSATGNDAERIKALAEGILARHPDDYFAHRASLWLARQNLLFGPGARQMRQALMERYRSLAEQRPGDPRYAVLYARSLAGTNTPLAIELLEKSAARAGEPQAHLTLAGIHSYGKFADRAKAARHLDSYVAACPAALDSEALMLLARLGSPESLARQAAALRRRLAGETDPAVLRFWERVWNLEFKARPVSEHEALRKQIALDLEGLEAVGSADDERWAEFLLNGYRMLGDPEKLRRAEERLLAQFPRSAVAKGILRERWRKQHPFPQPGDPEEKKQAFYRTELAWVGERLRDDPRELLYLLDRFRALVALTDSTGEQVAAAAEEVLAAWRERPPVAFLPPLEFQLAEGLLKKQVRVEAVPELVAQGLREFRQAEEERADDRTPEGERAPDAGNAFYVKTRAARILLEAAKRLNQPEIAASVVGELEAIQTENAARRSHILEIRARLAELEGRKLDALLLYRAAQETAARDEKEELGKHVERLRKELGGTEATKDVWERRERRVEVAEGPGRWETPSILMRPWELPDLEGRTWKLEALRGKTLFINVWATWCGPCRAEHPHLEKLYQKTKERRDLQVLSFNVDDEAGVVAPYVRDNRYTFPVLLASTYVSQLLPSLSIPQNWIVDAQGTWRRQQVGFGSGENWEREVLEQIEQVNREAVSRH